MRIVLVSVLCLGVSATAAFAGSREATEVRLKVSAQDYSDPAAMRALYGRIRTAADRACDSRMDRQLMVRSEDRACARQALEQTVRRMDKPALSLIHAEATGKAAQVPARTLASAD